jgi:hypothetical protein
MQHHKIDVNAVHASLQEVQAYLASLPSDRRVSTRNEHLSNLVARASVALPAFNACMREIHELMGEIESERANAPT